MTQPAAPEIVRIQHLHFAYADADSAIVSDWSTSLCAGVTLLHGDTGSGKTTVLRILAGVLAAEGRLALGAQVWADDPAAYRRHVFYGDPAADGFDRMTARACLAAQAAAEKSTDDARREALVAGFALSAHLDKPMYALSTGSRRKVWLAAALASPRALILLDEPTGGLDARSIRCLHGALADVAARQAQAVVVASAEGLETVPLAGSIRLPIH